MMLMSLAQGKRRIFSHAGSWKKSLLSGPLVLGLILVLSLCLRLYHLSSRPLYGDEPFHTVEVATHSLGHITTTNLGSTFYPLLVHLSLPLGTAETAARLPAALFGFLSVLAIYLLARRFFSKKEGLIAAFLMSVSTYQIYFSQQARAYTGFLLFSILSLDFFWRALHQGRVRFWLLYILSTAIGIYFHFIFLLVIPIHAFFALLLIFIRRVQKKTTKQVPPRKIAWGVSLSLVCILLLTFLLYLRVGQAPRQNTLFIYFRRALSSLFSLEMFRDPLRLMVVVTKRFLAYDLWPLFFFVQLALFLIGLVSCFRNHRKIAALFLSYWVLSFVLFVMSNPRRVYLTPANANKFMMLLPFVFILMAKGLSALHSTFGLAISRQTRKQQSPAVRNALWIVMMISLLLAEGVSLETYNVQAWQFYSLKRDSEINRYIADHVTHQEVIYFSDAPNRSSFYYAQLLPSPDGRRKKLMLFEDHVDYFITRDLSRRVGLFVVLNRTGLPPGVDMSQVKGTFHSDSFKELSRYWVLHFPADQRTLYDRLVPMIDLLAGLPRTGEGQRRESYLLLAKVHLLAQRTDEALRELARLDSLKSSVQVGLMSDQDSGLFKTRGLMILSRDKKSRSTRLQGLLQEKIGGLLIEHAKRASLQGKIDEAIALQTKAGHLYPPPAGTAFGFHLSLGQLYSKKGMKNESDREFMEALLARHSPGEETHVLNNIRELHALPQGFLVWKSGEICHLRWWSAENTTVSGMITSRRKLRRAEGFQLERDDKYKLLENRLRFVGIAHDDIIKGIDLTGERSSQLSFSLKIGGRRKIEKSVIILPGGVHPPGMPFVLDERIPPEADSKHL